MLCDTIQEPTQSTGVTSVFFKPLFKLMCSCIAKWAANIKKLDPVQLNHGSDQSPLSILTFITQSIFETIFLKHLERSFMRAVISWPRVIVSRCAYRCFLLR